MQFCESIKALEFIIVCLETLCYAWGYKIASWHCYADLVFPLNPDIAVAIYCGLQNLAATLVVCFETPVFLTGSQR